MSTQRQDQSTIFSSRRSSDSPSSGLNFSRSKFYALKFGIYFGYNVIMILLHIDWYKIILWYWPYFIYDVNELIYYSSITAMDINMFEILITFQCIDCHSAWSLVVVMLLLNWPPGNGSMVVLGLPKISLIQTHSSTWLALWWHFCQHAGLRSPLITPEELTMLTEHGPLNSEEVTPHPWMPSLEFHSKKDHYSCSRMVSLYGRQHSCSGQQSAPSMLLERTSSSSSGCTRTSTTITLRQVTSVSHSRSHLFWHTHSTSLERWSTCGPRREVVTAHGTTHIDNALSSWLKTWICCTSTSWQDTQHGWRGTVFHISSLSGWQIT